MPLGNISSSTNNNYLRVAQNEQKMFRLLLIPGDPKFGDIKEAWFHQLTENPIPGSGRDKGKFRGYARCLNTSRNDMTCPLCRDRKRFPASMRRACNVWSYSDNKIMVLFQGPQVWEAISASLGTYVNNLNAQNEAQGRSERYDVYSISGFIDFTITRNSNNQYQIMPVLNMNPVPVDMSKMIDLDTLDDYQFSTPENLSALMAELTAPQASYSPIPNAPNGFTSGPVMPTTGLASVNPAPSMNVAPPIPQVAPPMNVAPPVMSNLVPPPTQTAMTSPGPQFPPAIQMPLATMPPPLSTEPASPSLSIDDAKSITCTMGKYQGKTLGFIAENDPGYLVGYLQSSPNIPEGIVKTAISLIASNIESMQSDDNMAEFNSIGQVSVDELKQQITAALMSGAVSYDLFSTALLKCGNGKTSFDTFEASEIGALAQELGLQGA